VKLLQSDSIAMKLIFAAKLWIAQNSTHEACRIKAQMMNNQVTI
jgi:hypothetical protein